MSLTVWLIRHGQTTVNIGQWSSKPHEATLTPLGLEQAKAASLSVVEQPDLIVTSPLIRAQNSAQFLLERWKDVPHFIWPIQEFIYLSPNELARLTLVERKNRINAYWQKNDPNVHHGDGTESFADFVKRVETFHLALMNLQGFVVVVGHGQFFKAYQIGLEKGFLVTSEWMQRYRQGETGEPIKNGGILKINFNSQGSMH